MNNIIIIVMNKETKIDWWLVFMYMLYLLLSKIPSEVYQWESGRQELQGQAVLQMGQQPIIGVSLVCCTFMGIFFVQESGIKNEHP